MARSKMVVAKKNEMHGKKKAVKASKGLEDVRAAATALVEAPPAKLKRKNPVDMEKLAEARCVKYQNSTELLMQRAPLERYVRAEAGKLLPDVHFKADAMDLIHEAIEFVIARVSRDAQMILEQNGTSLMGGETFDIAAKIRGI